MADPNPYPQPDDLFDPRALHTELRDLLGPRLGPVLEAAASGNRSQLHDAERDWAGAVVATLGIHLSIAGLDRVDPDGQYIVAPLHEGFADVLALLRLPIDLTWVIRDELLNLPYFGEYLKVAGHIAVEPEAPRTALRSMLRQADEALSGGESLVVFPQGSLLGLDVAFRRGAFRLAERTGLPVLPVVLTGSHRVWEYPFQRTLRHGQAIFMEVLSPIDATVAVAGMRELEREMKRRALSVASAPVRRYVAERDGLWDGYQFEVDPDFVRAR